MNELETILKAGEEQRRQLRQYEAANHAELAVYLKAERDAALVREERLRAALRVAYPIVEAYDAEFGEHHSDRILTTIQSEVREQVEDKDE